jgi:TonB family protein
MKILILLCLLITVNQNADCPQAKESIAIKHISSPNYNRVARMARLQGEVELAVSIGRDGEVRSVTVLKTNANKLLQDDAVNNIKAWTFNPGDERGLHTTYEFRLILPELPYDSPTSVNIDFPQRIRVESNFKAKTLD